MGCSGMETQELQSQKTARLRSESRLCNRGSARGSASPALITRCPRRFCLIDCPDSAGDKPSLGEPGPHRPGLSVLAAAQIMWIQHRCHRRSCAGRAGAAVTQHRHSGLGWELRLGSSLANAGRSKHDLE